MAYKRYFYINNKRYGPYYYESYRDKTGKVKKRYVKREALSKVNKKQSKKAKDLIKKFGNNPKKSSAYYNIIIKDRFGIIRMKKVK
jgi:hypothetical protein